MLNDPDISAGIGILSGMIFNSLKTKQNRTVSTSFFIAHGDQDKRILFNEAETAVKWLKKNRYKYEFHTYSGMGHMISEEEVKDWIMFIQKNIS